MLTSWEAISLASSVVIALAGFRRTPLAFDSHRDLSETSPETDQSVNHDRDVLSSTGGCSRQIPASLRDERNLLVRQTFSLPLSLLDALSEHKRVHGACQSDQLR